MKFHNHIVAPAKFLVRLVIVLTALAAMAMPSSSWAAKPDRTPPTVPTGVSAMAVSCSQVNLSWTASTDSGSGVKQYNVYRNGSLIKTVAAPSTSTSDASLAGSTYYSYTVSAVDNKGNTSAQSSAAGVTTPSCSTCTDTITTGVSPAGAGSISGGGAVACNSSVTVAASASSCYNFVSWTENGTVVSTSASYTFTATANRSLVANFSQKTYTVSVGASAGGSVSGGGTYSCGSSATVTATAASCYHFVNWTENGTVVSTSSSYVFTVSANRSLVANFAQNTYTISTGVSPSGSGTTSGSGTYGCGSTVTVSASAASGYSFGYWSENGTVVSSSASYSFVASANRTLTATFAAAACGYSLNSSSASFAPAGGSSSFGITTGSSCSWTASTAYSWITVNSSSGTGNGNVYYTVAMNASTSSRSGTITVGGQTFTITQTGDTSAPSVSLTSPLNGNTLSNTVPTSATASDSSTSVSKVEFYRDSGVLIGTATGSSYSVNWDTTAVSNGSHTVYAKAYDAAGNVTTSSANSVTVNNTVASVAPPSGQLLWTQTTSGSLVVESVKADANGNVYFAGKFQANVIISGVYLTSRGGWDGFLAKFGSGGTLLWVKQVGATLDDDVRSLALDSQNNVVMTGYFEGTVDFGGGGITSYGYADIFVVKYTSSGSLLWARNYGGGLNDVGNSVAIDGADNVFVAAQFEITASFGGVNLTSVGNDDLAIFKIAGSTGSTFWAKNYGTTGYDFPASISADLSGNVVVTGQANGSINLGGGAIGSGGTFVAKYAGADGAYQWARSLGTSVTGNAIATDPSTGNVLITGGFSGAVDFGGGNIATRWNGGIFMAGYDIYGNYLWAKGYGQNGDAGYALSCDSTGHIALAMYNGGLADFSGTGSYTAGNFLAIFAVTGNAAPVFQWSAGSSTSSGNSAAFDSIGHVLVAGPAGSSGFVSQFTK